jgi:hypothetical protein
MGRHHVIRPFIDDILLIEEYLGKEGLQVCDEAFGVTFNEGLPAKFFGAMEINSMNKEFALAVGIRGSYDQSLPRGLAVGSRVFVCDNLAFSSDIVLTTRQTTYINDRMPFMLREAISEIPLLAHRQEKDYANYKGICITPRDGDTLLLQCLRKEVINTQQFARALASWDTMPGNSTVWDLYNVVTAAIKPPADKPNILNAWTRGIGLTDIINKACL